MKHIETALKASRTKARATLIRLLRDIDHAEDALQSACLQACKVWPDKFPDNPVAWLVTVGRNRFVDEYRKYEREKPGLTFSDSEFEFEVNYSEQEHEFSPVDDDSLRLIFTCCHPVLKPESQIALTLRIVCDLSIEEIARAFLIPGKTLEKRITRAKEKIKTERIPYEIPERAALSERKAIVLHVVYLIFNEGYLSSSDKYVINESLCHQAILLGRRLVSLFPSDPEVSALLSLMLLLHARYQARLDSDEKLLTLEEQDRTLWSRTKTEEACAMLEISLRKGSPGPYQLQASIAAIHNQSAHFRDTDWKQISLLYRFLEEIQPSLVVKLNSIVAICYAQGPELAWERLSELNQYKEFSHYAPFYGVKAELLERRKKYCEAVNAYEQALELTENRGEKDYVHNKINMLKTDQ